MTTLGFALMFTLGFGPQMTGDQEPLYPTMENCMTVLSAMVYMDPTIKVGCYRVVLEDGKRVRL